MTVSESVARYERLIDALGAHGSGSRVMKLIDRLVAVLVVLVVVACVLPPLVAPVTSIAVVLTVCFVVIRLTRYFTGRW
jgi:hypothetical protein